MTAARIGLVAWAALVVEFAVWQLWWLPPSQGSAAVAAALLIVPLLLPLLALGRDTRRARLWVGILTLFYFIHGVVTAYAEPRVRVPALIEVLLCLVFIGALGYEARHYKRRRG
jgi:uncharacterized membrane protein